jgi:antitoxin component of MazEF toxin-antitoxin module
MTIKTTQKVIKIGTSAGVTIPAKDLKRAGIQPGDEIELLITPKKNKLSDFSEEFDSFMDTYSEDLDRLAKR